MYIFNLGTFNQFLLTKTWTFKNNIEKLKNYGNFIAYWRILERRIFKQKAATVTSQYTHHAMPVINIIHNTQKVH